MKKFFVDGFGERATLEKFSDGKWFVDMGCCLWNKYYKSEKLALSFLKKEGFVETNPENVES